MVYDRDTHPSVYSPYPVKPICLHITHGCFLTTMVELSCEQSLKYLLPGSFYRMFPDPWDKLYQSLMFMASSPIPIMCAKRYRTQSSWYPSHLPMVFLLDLKEGQVFTGFSEVKKDLIL